MYKFPTDADNTLWNTITAGEHWFNVRARIAGTIYGQDQIVEMTASSRVFSGEQPAVGGCIAGELSLKMLKPSATIPRMAKVEPFVQAANDDYSSAWMPQGVYYIDTREETRNDDGIPVLSMHCYDAMLMAEQEFPSITGGWPRSDIDVVKIIAKHMGLQSSVYLTTGIDQRTVDAMDKAYQINLPASYSLRETLSYVAAMYAGNFVMSFEGKLLLVTISGIPAETSLLVDESGNVITFGIDPDTGEELAISLVDTSV